MNEENTPVPPGKNRINIDSADWTQYRYWVVRTLEDIQSELKRHINKVESLNTVVNSIDKEETKKEIESISKRVAEVQEKVTKINELIIYSRGKMAGVGAVAGLGASLLIQLFIKLVFK